MNFYFEFLFIYSHSFKAGNEPHAWGSLERKEKKREITTQGKGVYFLANFFISPDFCFFKVEDFGRRVRVEVGRACLREEREEGEEEGEEREEEGEEREEGEEEEEEEENEEEGVGGGGGGEGIEEGGEEAEEAEAEKEAED